MAQRTNWMTRQIRAEEARRAELSLRYAGMTDAAIAAELVGLMDESVEITRTWGRDGSDAYYASLAESNTRRVELARAELAARARRAA